jgi:hypothetical protein
MHAGSANDMLEYLSRPKPCGTAHGAQKYCMIPKYMHVVQVALRKAFFWIYYRFLTVRAVHRKESTKDQNLLNAWMDVQALWPQRTHRYAKCSEGLLLTGHVQ